VRFGSNVWSAPDHHRSASPQGQAILVSLCGACAFTLWAPRFVASRRVLR